MRLKFIPLVLVALFSCSTHELKERVQDKDFVPFRIGYFAEYKIMEITYAGSFMDTTQYDLFMEVVDSVLLPDKGVGYTVHIRMRPLGTTVWRYEKSGLMHINDFRVTWLEGDQSFVKLAFPLENGRSWDGNSLNQLSREDYWISDSGVAYEGLLSVFPNCLTVNQKEVYNALEEEVRFEIYAHQIGMVKKEIKQFSFCSVGDCFGKYQIQSGFHFIQELIGYGYH